MNAPLSNSDSYDSPTGHGLGTDAQAPKAPGARPRDEESGNTSSHSCIGEHGEIPVFKVLWQGIDTLEVSFRGKISEKSDESLKFRKELAQSNRAKDQARAQMEIGGRVFEVGDRGGGRFFAYLLRHSDMRIALSSSRAERTPLAYVTFQNQFLVSVGPRQATEAARMVLEELAEELDSAETVSRIDQAVDVWTGQDIGAWLEDAWVTRAMRTGRYVEDGAFSGWTIGAGAALSGRLYDKLLEINTRSKKWYFLDLWNEAGWFLGDPVKRLEHQFRRSVLAQFNLKSLDDVLEALPALWSYATRDWTRLTIPNAGDDTKARWPLHPFWEQVQAVKWEGKAMALSRRVLNTGAPADATLARMFKAVVTAVMARDGLASVDAGAERLCGLLMGRLQREEEWEGAPADELLMEAVNLKRRKYCLPVITP